MSPVPVLATRSPNVAEPESCRTFQEEHDGTPAREPPETRYSMCELDEVHVQIRDAVIGLERTQRRLVRADPLLSYVRRVANHRVEVG